MTGGYRQRSPIGKGEANFDGPDIRELAGLPDDIRRDPGGAAAMHGAAFLGFLLLREGLATVDEILGDFGLVHELAHLRLFGAEPVTGRAASAAELADFAETLIGRLR